jgi:cytochrome oxidase Cu insertion factor (SCO1/SenC/PrrC family)
MSRRPSRARAIALAVAAVTLAGLLPAGAFAALGHAPAFTLRLLNGKTLSLADLKGAPVILLFWAPW